MVRTFISSLALKVVTTALRVGGFASLTVGVDGLTGPQRAAKAGRIGGLKSRRGSNKKGI